MNLSRAAVLAAALVLGACSGAPSAPTPGSLPGPVPDGVSFREPPASAPPAPAFSLELLDGRMLDLAEQWRQRPVVLVFFETWCTRCREQQVAINEVVADYRDIVLFVGVASGSAPADVAQYVAEHRLGYPVGTDPSGRAALRYAVAEPPLVALISKDGRLLRGWSAGIAGTELREQLDQLAVETR
ncbi:MAG: TlpA family protein disulfide reductase [Natronosporangium sp.]